MRTDPSELVAILDELDHLEAMGGQWTPELAAEHQRIEGLLLDAIVDLELWLEQSLAEEEKPEMVCWSLQQTRQLQQEVAAREAQLEQLEQIRKTKRAWVAKYRERIQNGRRLNAELEDQIVSACQSITSQDLDQLFDEEQELHDQIAALRRRMEADKRRELTEFARENDELAAKDDQMAALTKQLETALTIACEHFPLDAEASFELAEEQLERAAELLKEEEQFISFHGEQCLPLGAELEGGEARLSWTRGELEGHQRWLTIISGDEEQATETLFSVARAAVEKEARSELSSHQSIDIEGRMRRDWIAGEISGRKIMEQLILRAMEPQRARISSLNEALLIFDVTKKQDCSGRAK
jgi:hypothetical protein